LPCKLWVKNDECIEIRLLVRAVLNCHPVAYLVNLPRNSMVA